MSLPGLGLEEPEEAHIVETAQHDLEKDCEWRFEVPVGKYVQVKVDPSLALIPRETFSLTESPVGFDWSSRVIRHRTRRWELLHLHWNQSRNLHLAWLCF